jgi:hypothetical protein
MLEEWQAFKGKGKGLSQLAQPITTTVLVRNDSGATVPVFGVLGLGSPLVLPTDNAFAAQAQPAFAGSTPTVGTHEGKWVVLLGPASYSTTDPANCIARAVLVGHAVVRVYVTATTDTHVDVSDDHTVSSETVYVSTGSSGARILWLDPAATAATIAYAVVCLGGGGGSGSSLHWGVLGADLKYGDTTGVSVTLDAGGTWENVLPSKLLPEGKMWLIGSAVLVVEVDGAKYAIQGTCLDDVP